MNSSNPLTVLSVFNYEKFLLIFFFMFCLALKNYAQQSQIDSLTQVLKEAKEDTNKVNLLHQLCEKSQDLDQVMDYGQQAFQLAKRLNYQKGIADACNHIADVNFYRGNVDTSIEYVQKALQISESIHYQIGIGVSLNNMAVIYHQLGNYAKAMEYLQKSLKFNEQIKNNEGIGTSLNTIGSIYQSQGNLTLALDYFQRSLAAHEETGNKELIGLELGNIGQLLNEAGENSKAMDYYLKSLKIFEATGNKLGISAVLGNIGTFYYEQHDTLRAIEYAKKSLKIQEEIGEKHGIAISLNNIGSYYNHFGLDSDALVYHLKSMKLCEEIGDKTGIARSLTHISIYCLEHELLDSALQLANRCLKLGDEIGAKNYSSGAMKIIAKIYLEKLNYHEAQKYGERALELAKESELPDVILNTSKLLCDIYSKQGNYKDAYQMHILFKQMSDSVSNAATRDSAWKKVAKYEFDIRETVMKAEQEKKDALALSEISKQKVIRNSISGGTAILILSSVLIFISYRRRRNAEEQKKEVVFKNEVADAKMKALRAQMNPHFIFNSLNSIQLFLQKSNIDDAGKYLNKFAKLMRLILENSVHEEVLLEKDIEALKLYMDLEKLRMKNDFTFEIKTGDDIDPSSVVVPPLLIQPFVENSIWHGMLHKTNGNGKITVHILKENDMINCVIEDNGVGRVKANELKETLSQEKHESLGMKITEERIGIINKIKNSKAFVAITDLYDEAKNSLGTKVEVKLPYELNF